MGINLQDITTSNSMTGGTRDDDESCTEPVGRCSVFYYGVGHMLNDVTSACWFTYLLVFLTDIGLPPRLALYQLFAYLFNLYFKPGIYVLSISHCLQWHIPQRVIYKFIK